MIIAGRFLDKISLLHLRKRRKAVAILKHNLYIIQFYENLEENNKLYTKVMTLFLRQFLYINTGNNLLLFLNLSPTNLKNGIICLPLATERNLVSKMFGIFIVGLKLCVYHS